MIAQLTFLPALDHEPRKRASVPVCKQDERGRWCWLKFGTQEYVHEPELERVLLAALARGQRKAA